MSGTATPLSASETLTNPPSPTTKPLEAFQVKDLLKPSSPLPVPLPISSPFPTTASQVVQALASSLSSTIFAYDVSLFAAGFGDDSLRWAQAGDGAKVVEMQARAGAGLALLGRLSSGAGTSKEGSSLGNVLTAYINPPGLALMGPALSALPEPTATSRLVVQCPAVTPVEDGTKLTPSLGDIAPAVSLLDPTGKDLIVILSATPKETAAVAQLSYILPKHVVHIFDQFSSARELTVVPLLAVAPADGPISLQTVLHQLDFSYFSYYGDSSASHVIVTLNSALALTLRSVVESTPGVGLLIVRVLRPWDEIEFASALPTSTKHLYVVDQVISELETGLLYPDVLGAAVGSADLTHVPGVHSLRVTPAQLATYTATPAKLLSALTPSLPSISEPTFQIPKKLAFLTSPTSTLPATVAHTFLLSSSVQTRLVSATDGFSHPGGVCFQRILLHPGAKDSWVPIDEVFPIAGTDELGQADFITIAEPSLFKSHDVLSYARKGASVLVYASWTAEEFASNLPPKTKELAHAKEIRFYTFDGKDTLESLVPVTFGKEKGKGDGGAEELERILELITVLRLYLVGAGGAASVEKVIRAIYGSFPGGVPVNDVCGAVWKRLHEVIIPLESEEPKETAQQKELKQFEFNTISTAGLPEPMTAPVPRVSAWHAAAKLLLFRDCLLVPEVADSTEQPVSLHPESTDRTFLVTCTVNRRLTPTTYDRNVFHLEFDTAGTGLKYAIGEALGVQGWNDTNEVIDFISWYGADPDAVVSVPLPDGSRGVRHLRTVFQLLQQVVDIFGKPPKSFYAALSALATAKADRMALRFISAPEGSATFKKLSEVDTVTFADVLRMYPSARPPIEELVELVGFIKPRHYSIASSQAAVGDRVDLLVVTVDWVTPSGSPRYGQCTRYLAGLKPGQKVTVSIKPSVMKLPPNDLQPIIMAGLGTGAAPFRAFMQHRAWQAAQSIPVGPLIYYFGSRHRSQEYLYGEEIEAYIRDGIISHAGLAFSRDTNKKVYIQHKMNQDGPMLSKMLTSDDKGVFYLCGPTWPVPDVYQALVSSLTAFSGMSKDEAEKYIEELKEDERYVLEVY